MLEYKQLNKENFVDLMQATLADAFEKASMRDKAFACYYLIKTGRQNTVKEFIENTVNEIGASINKCMELAYWLWVVSEYLNETKDFVWLDTNMSTIKYCSQCIKTNWDKEYEHWLIDSISGIFTGNIAIMYGAINGINKFLNDIELEQWLVEIGFFTFLENIREGEYVGRKASLAVLGDMGDISVIGVPFGLVKVYDLFYERSINSIEKKLLTEGIHFSKNNYFPEDGARADLTCLLSWYYSETGHIEYSEWMLKQAEKILLRDEEPCEESQNSGYISKTKKSAEECERETKCKNLSLILYAIASHNLSAKKQSKGKQLPARVNILHKPAGENDPYNSKDYERYPRYPEVNEDVYLKINTRPFNPNQEVYVNYWVNGKSQPRIRMNIETASSDERHWQACIGKFATNDRVDYEFEVFFNGKKEVSPQYSFNVRQWHSLKEIEYVEYTDDGAKLLFSPVGSLKGIPCLHVRKNNEDSLNFSFSLEQRENLYHAINIKEKANIKIFSLKLGNISLEFNGYKICFKILGIKGDRIFESYDANNTKLLDLLIDESGKVSKVRFNFLKEDNEKIYGMGERFSHIEFSGLEVDNCVYDKYKNHGLKTYLPIPFFMSSKGYGIFFDSSTYLKCRFGSRVSDLNEIEVNLESNRQSLDFYVFTGKPKKIVQGYTDLTGKPALPPKWCFGLWISGNSWDCQKDIYEQIDKTKEYDIPTSAIILEQWSDESTFYIFNGAKYDVKPGEYYFKYKDFKFQKDGRWPNPKKMVEYLHKLGIRVLLWQSPYHTFLGSAVNKQRDVDENAMLEKGYHVKYKDGKEYRSHIYWFGHSLIPDFTNPEARNWWLNKRKYLIKDIGIDGFKIDGGESILDAGLVFHNGKTEEEMRNEYPNEFVGGFSDFVKQHVKGGGIVFSRAGYKGAQKISLHWAGDDESTFNAFRESVNGGLSSGMSGIAFWGWDFGGFCGDVPTAELYLRSVQMSVFCPILQYHSESMAKRIYDRTPWNIAERANAPYVIDIFKKFIDLRMNILPYIYQQAIFSSKTGIPMMRAMFLEYPDDENCSTMTQQYMFGESMLVAPVMEEGAFDKDVYLPEGKWMDFFTGEVVDGGKSIKVGADIEQIPVYIKENSIIPLNLSNDCKLFGGVGNEMEGYKNLSFLIHVTRYAKCEFNDDLGNKVSVEAFIRKNTINISIEGNYEGDITLISKGTHGIEALEIDGNETPEANTFEALNSNTFINSSEGSMIRLCCHNKNMFIKAILKSI